MDDGSLTTYSDFIKKYPEYEKTTDLDDLRQHDYARMKNHVYLDYTGGGLYAASQLQQHMSMLSGGVYGNPHSSNPTSMAMTELADRARAYVFEYFNADPNDYIVVFTPNASGALKLVGESYPFEQNGQYLLTYDNHNSVNGIREFARARGAKVTYAPVTPPDLRIDAARLREHFTRAFPGGNNLFAYPAQSNFSGVKHALTWIEEAHTHGWDVLLDSAAYAPTNCLDIDRWQPDFVTLSFYKIFGYPTGIGALIAKREAVQKLRRPWFAGGTITVASVQGDGHWLADGEAAFEDGTIDYLNIPAVENGLRHMNAVGVEQIGERVRCLTGWLLDQLTSLHHSNGEPLARIYGPTTTEARGGTVALNLYDPDGHLFDYRDVEAEANQRDISLRTGCFCNPGAGELALNLAAERMVECFQGETRLSYEEYAVAMTSLEGETGTGAVRVSLGLVSNFEDVQAFIDFARTFVDRSAR